MSNASIKRTGRSPGPPTKRMIRTLCNAAKRDDRMVSLSVKHPNATKSFARSLLKRGLIEAGPDRKFVLTDKGYGLALIVTEAKP